MFADDTTHFSHFKTNADANTFVSILEIAQIVTRLQVNIEKTQLVLFFEDKMTPGEQDAYKLISKQITKEVTHLGLQVTNTAAGSVAATWVAVHKNFTNAADPFS